MVAYFVVQLTINDRAKYDEYSAGFLELWPEVNGRILAVDDSPDVLEGEWNCTRTILSEFPSKADAMKFYESEAYQRLCELRWAGCETNFVLVEGR